MTDEQDGLDASLVKRKLTKRERFRGVVQRVSKVKKSDEESTRDGDFTLNDDVKDFLAFRSPYSKPAAVLSSPPESQKPDTKLATPAASKTDVDEFLHATDPADALPHFPTPSRDPLPVPRIDVAKSPRFPLCTYHIQEWHQDRICQRQNHPCNQDKFHHPKLYANLSQTQLRTHYLNTFHLKACRAWNST
jgi:hypothetical protein